VRVSADRAPESVREPPEHRELAIGDCERGLDVARGETAPRLGDAQMRARLLGAAGGDAKQVQPVLARAPIASEAFAATDEAASSSGLASRALRRRIGATGWRRLRISSSDSSSASTLLRGCRQRTAGHRPRLAPLAPC